MLLATLTLAALAAPPSSTLVGKTGELSWQVEDLGDRLRITGHSPKWTVVHVAGPDLKPIRTERTDASGRKAEVVYGSGGATVTLPDKTLKVDRTDLWDADTLDVRLGKEFTAGRTEIAFPAIDTDSGNWYWFDASKVGDETCGSRPCTHVKVQLSGWRRPFGPTFQYWFAADGALLRFDGPAGAYEAR